MTLFTRCINCTTNVLSWAGVEQTLVTTNRLNRWYINAVVYTPVNLPKNNECKFVGQQVHIAGCELPMMIIHTHTVTSPNQEELVEVSLKLPSCVPSFSSGMY